ncbi:MAG: class I SAM-dependent methyltransferase [Ginsengibacter sp.]|jgi:SAM-dependent methyltransferase
MPDTNAWFKEWFNSPYYHQLYHERDEKEAAEFINQMVIHLQPPGGSFMLDVACGRGRHSIQLASQGFDVTGIDLSVDSIMAAKENENDHLHFFVHDMRLPFWINYFNYAFNIFTSFGYFNTRREHENALRTIAQSLKPDGIFVIDYLNVEYAESHPDSESEIKIDNINYHITKWSDEGHFYKKIVIEDMNFDSPIVHEEKVAKFSLEDFTQMLANHQMQVQEVFGDYNLKSYDQKESPRMVIIAKKIRPQEIK